jgi:hypothetical protein
VGGSKGTVAMMESRTPRFLSSEELYAGLDDIRRSPKSEGMLAMIVRRPRIEAREVVESAELDLKEGLVGDTWKSRSSRRSADGLAHPHMQINIMNARVIDLIAQDRDRWPLAGDQLYLDLDLSEKNLPPGTQLAIGAAIIEITAEQHTGCEKFSARFGVDAMKWVNSAVGRELHLRGVNARVVRSGAIRVGDIARKL